VAGTLRLVEEAARAIGHAAALRVLSMRDAALFAACGADVWRQRVGTRMPPSLFGRPTEIALASAVVAKARAKTVAYANSQQARRESEQVMGGAAALLPVNRSHRNAGPRSARYSPTSPPSPKGRGTVGFPCRSALAFQNVKRLGDESRVRDHGDTLRRMPRRDF
jgi:hypothetical protein